MELIWKSLEIIHFSFIDFHTVDAEIPNNLGCMKPVVNNGIFIYHMGVSKHILGKKTKMDGENIGSNPIKIDGFFLGKFPPLFL